MLGFLLALPTPRGHELPDGDPVLEGWLVYGALYLDQVVLRGQTSSHIQLLVSRRKNFIQTNHFFVNMTGMVFSIDIESQKSLSEKAGMAFTHN